MNSPNLKADIINHIENCEDNELISDIAHLIKANNDYNQFTFTDSQKKVVFKAITQYKEGSYVTGEVAEKEIQKWLKD